jgi:L-ascorbate metabolism protein UlaG (beta-lactamase superfamily)
VRITWVGHSTVLIELDGVRLCTDPVVRGRLMHLRRVSGNASTAALRELDAVLISHLHHDHLDLPTLDGLGRSTKIVVPAGGGKLLRRRGFEHVTEVEVGEQVAIEAVAVSVTHAEHRASRSPFTRDTPTVGYLIEGSVRIYFAGDTDVFEEMSELGPELDMALLPVAGWGPRLPPGHLDPARAAQALTLLRPRIAVPIHWGTYRRIGLADDASLLRMPAESFARLAREAAPEVDVRILPVGGSLELTPAVAS